MPDTPEGAVGTDTAETSATDLDSIVALAQSELNGSDEGSEGSNTEPEGTEVEAPSEGETAEDAQRDESTDTYTVKVDGEDIEVSFDELLKGYQRQADYTRKTQALASDRERLAAFEALDVAFANDPVGTLQGLAQAMGVDLAGPDQGTQGNDAPELDSEDPVTKELADLRQWRQEVEAERQARETADRQAAVDREIEAVKVAFNASDLKETELLQFAIDNQIPNLEVAFKAMSFEVLAHALKDGFGIKDPGRFLAPDPNAQQMLGMTSDDMPLGDEPEEGTTPEDPAAAAMAAQLQAQPRPFGGPPGGYAAAAAAEEGGGVPPELLAQLAGQVGLTV